MSYLQKSFAKAKLSSLPFNPPTSTDTTNSLPEAEFEDEDEDVLRLLPHPTNNSGGMEVVGGSLEVGVAEDRDDEGSASSASSASSAGSTGTIRPEPRKGRFAKGGMGTDSASAIFPLSWSSYFAQEFYLTSSSTPFVHHIYFTSPATAASPLFVLHHGAGCSGLSFAACAAEIKRLAPEVGLLAVDARGHGETILKETKENAGSGAEVKDGKLDMSLEELGRDLEIVVQITKEKMGWDSLPGLVLIGHSLGGAVVTHVAKGGSLGNKVLGFAVLDVVEGSAMDALKSMNAYLATRPTSFRTLEMGIDWHVRSRTIRGLLSARVSVPSYLSPLPPSSSQPQSPKAQISQFSNPTDPANTSLLPPPADTLPRPQPWVWRTDLSATSDYWENWFGGMSSKFLSARGGKLLLLAGTDRLDKELMIGQMQGKYQLQVFPDSGHFIQEDLPEKTAGVLVDFWRRNDGRLVLPPKVAARIAGQT